jgi:hypothetical protein
MAIVAIAISAILDLKIVAIIATVTIVLVILAIIAHVRFRRIMLRPADSACADVARRKTIITWIESHI